MAYDAKNGKEVTLQSNLEKNKLYSTVILKIDDGIVKQFLDDKVQQNWQGSLDGNAINVTYQLPSADKKEHVEISQVFTYNVGENGETEYSETSNMAKYSKQYGKLPEVGDEIQVLTNSHGKPKILLG